MARNLVFGASRRPAVRCVSSLACLAFVFLLGAAFWSGAVWIGQALLQVSASGH